MISSHNEYRVVSASAGDQVTGSIARALAIGPYNGQASLSSVEFGKFKVPESSWTPTTQLRTSVDGDDGIVVVPNGSYLEGPMGRTEVRSGAFLFYINY